MRTRHYPSDVTDAQWKLIEPHLPPQPGGGRPRETSMRDVLDAIFYILRTGCQWRYLPGDLPPRCTVWRYFDRWRHDGTLDRIHDLLRKKVRTAEEPYHPRTSASVDRQSVGTTSGGEPRGRDNAKDVDGRKRPIVVDSMGLLLAVPVTAASVDDAAAAPELFARLDGQPMGKVVRMYADSKYHNSRLDEWVEGNAKWDMVIIRRPADERGWVKLPIRWTVERHFAPVKTVLHGEIEGQGRPRAALFAMGMALVAANALAVVKQALRATHGEEEFERLSGYYLADGVAGNYRAVDVLVSEAEWLALGAEPAEGFWGWCRGVAARVRTRGLHKHPRRPKKPQPPRASGKDRHHYSTYRLLNERDRKC